MTQVQDVTNCTALSNSVDIVNCIRQSLGYNPVVPEATTDEPSTTTNQYGLLTIAAIGGLLYLMFMRK